MNGVEPIFAAALKIESESDRKAFLDKACGDDADLRADVEGLLKANARAGSFLNHPPVGSEPTLQVDDLQTIEDAKASAASLAFLEPCETPDRVGRLGVYEIIDVVGVGGMGIVLRAFDTKLQRTVAVKVMAPELAANPTAVKRFLREARKAAAVVNDHVVTIHAVDDSRRPPFLVMEFIDGQTLQQKIDREGALSLEAILRIGTQIAEGLAAAHKRGLIHRDVKPANILLENSVERVKITDFGLARAVDDVGMTRTGEVAGTPEFMSPEQAQGLAIDQRSDLFSFGSVLYAMCTGRSPFRADTTVAVLRRVCDDVPRPIREVNPEIPEGLVSIIDRLLAKNPDDRFQTAEEVAELLGQHLAYFQHPANVRAPSPSVVTGDVLVKTDSGDELPPPPHRPSRRGLWSVVGLGLLVVVASVSITEATGVTQFAASVIRIVTGEGTLAITVDDPNVCVTIEDQDIVITGAGPKEVRLKPGEYRLRANKNGKSVPVDQKLVTITRGGRKVVHVTLVPPVPGATLEIDKRPFHLAAGPTLGAGRGLDTDGLPSGKAKGGDPDASDERGVTFGSPIMAGQLDASLTVNVQNAPTGAKLDAWIDFNADGCWGGPGEHIADRLPVSNGDNPLQFDVPSWVAGGKTYARFRLSSAGNLAPTGPADDGEVEDYQLSIAPPAAASGRFEAGKVISAAGDKPYSLFAADVDGDGDMDVLSALAGDKKIAWYENKGNGNFTLYPVSVAHVDGT